MGIQPYGAMIAVGVVVSGTTGWLLSKRFSLDFNDIILLFTYGLSLGFVGAKATYLMLNVHRIPWSEVSLMQVAADGGYVFYGGLPLGAVGVLLAWKIHKLDLRKCLRICAPLLPLGHAFGRIGCCIAGCCYGVDYDGIFAVTYHRSAIAPNEVPLFPVQLLEAALLVLLSGVLLIAVFKGVDLRGMGVLYFGGYSIMRFWLEFFRGDLERGVVAGLSTSQWISLSILTVLPILFWLRQHKEEML